MFELAELKGRGDVQAVVLMLVVFLATQRMYHGPRTRAKAIVIDEAWDLLSGEDSRAFLEGAARRARKYRGALVTGTQSVNDYYANPAARAAWENSDWVIFLGQKDESVELLKSEGRIHCDAGMERALKSLSTADGRYAELVLHGPDGWRVARLVLDAWSVALFSSRGPAFAAVESLKAEGLSTVEAIDRIVGAGRRRRFRSKPFRNRETRRRTPHEEETNSARAPAKPPLNWPGDPEAVTAGDVDFEALAHVLANTCRNGGRCRRYHSVAAHAAFVSEEVEALGGLAEEDRRTLALHALLADAPSAWLRGRMPESQRAAERAGRLAARIDAAVRDAAGLDPVLDEERAELLRFVTRMAAASERRDVVEDVPAGAGVAFPPLQRRIRPMPPDKAAEAWLARFRALGGEIENTRKGSAAKPATEGTDAGRD